MASQHTVEDVMAVANSDAAPEELQFKPKNKAVLTVAVAATLAAVFWITELNIFAV